MKCGICGENRTDVTNQALKEKSLYEVAFGSNSGAGCATTSAVNPEAPTARDIEDLASYMRGYADAMELYASALAELAGFNE